MSASAQPDSTYPFRHFRLFLLVWHVLYLGALAAVLAMILVQDRGEWGLRHLLVAGCLVGQAALYVLLVVRQSTWPIGRWEGLAYFGGTLALWAAAWSLDARASWLGMMVVGQMFGILGPRAAVPGATMVAFYFFARNRDWDLAGISWVEVAAWAGMVVVFLYMNELFRSNIERMKLIGELKASQRELEEARRNDVELAALRERERLAREMHDGLGHALAAISVQLEAVQRLYRVDPEKASAQVDALKGLTRASMDELRHALAGLRAPGLGSRPLEPALRELCTAFEQRSKVETGLRVGGRVDDLPPAVTEMVWRVVQEALTNVEKHAGAARVQVDLAVTPRLLDLRVCDDGAGIPAGLSGSAPRPVAGHYGLVGLTERVEGLGGTFCAERAAGGGTCVRAQVPLGGKEEE